MNPEAKTCEIFIDNFVKKFKIDSVRLFDT